MAYDLDRYLGDVPDVTGVNESDVEGIRNWMKAQPHLPTISDRQISIFLHCCCGALELTKNTIDSYYTIRTYSPELFAGRNQNDFVKTLDTVYMFKLPRFSVDDCHILYYGLNDLDPEKLVVPDALRLFFSLVDVYSNSEPNANGWRVFFNSKGFTFGHFVKLSTCLALFKTTIYYLQDALPIRLRGIHLFNANPFISQFVALIKPFMKKELYELINIHPESDTKSLYKFILPENLPNNANGKCGEINDLTKTSIDHLDKYRIWFAEEEKVAKVDESKRIGKSKIQNDSFGVDGSFKKLSVD